MRSGFETGHVENLKYSLKELPVDLSVSDISPFILPTSPLIFTAG